MNRVLDAREALRGALELRRKLRVPRELPINALDAAGSLGLRVQLSDLASCEGMLSRDANIILLNNLRPAGRRAFTCAHELGHWHLGHGNALDMLDFDEDDQDKPLEQLVNSFAGFFLMPKRAIQEALARRQWHVGSLTPQQAFILSGQFGVGYQTLIQHLHRSVQLIAPWQLSELERWSPKSLRHALAGPTAGPHLLVGDAEWGEVPIDLEVGDSVLLPPDIALSGDQLEPGSAHGVWRHCVAGKPGISNIQTENWTCFVRVSRREFTGWAKYRHFPENESDTNSA